MLLIPVPFPSIRWFVHSAEQMLERNQFVLQLFVQPHVLQFSHQRVHVLLLGPGGGGKQGILAAAQLLQRPTVLDGADQRGGVVLL
jgi:hypothetical protein